MTATDLKEEIAIELDFMEGVVHELLAIQKDKTQRELTLREKTATGAFLAQFYNGVENILKRITYFYGIEIPHSDTWHVDLFRQFCSPAKKPLPELFDEDLAASLAPYRRFRHVVYHSYGMQLDWQQMGEGVMLIETVFLQFKSRLADYLHSLEY